MEFEDLKIEVPLDDDINSDLFHAPVKKYKNKDGNNFITGIDITSKEEEERRLKRAKRFGLSVTERNKTELEPLPSNLKDLPLVDGDTKIRPDAILLFGVNEMSTKDVFDYFQDYLPSSLEWIDDTSCVVVWDDENSAKRAFANMGIQFSPSKDALIDNIELSCDIWRIGAKHPKAKQLLMRFATNADRKTKGARSRSLYYLLHGLPGTQQKRALKRGLISLARRKKIEADKLHMKKAMDKEAEVEILDQALDETMDVYDDEMDVDEPAFKVFISENFLEKKQSVSYGNMYSDKQERAGARSRLENTLNSNISCSTKIDDNLDRNVVSDLRQRLKSRVEPFNR